jgi:hypothetical protein
MKVRLQPGRESANWKQIMLGYGIFTVIVASVVLLLVDDIVEPLYSYVKTLTLETTRATFILVIKLSDVFAEQGTTNLDGKRGFDRTLQAVTACG